MDRSKTKKNQQRNDVWDLSKGVSMHTSVHTRIPCRRHGIQPYTHRHVDYIIQYLNYIIQESQNILYDGYQIIISRSRSIYYMLITYNIYEFYEIYEAREIMSLEPACKMRVSSILGMIEILMISGSLNTRSVCVLLIIILLKSFSNGMTEKVGSILDLVI